MKAPQRRDVACERCGVLARDRAVKWARWEAAQHAAIHKVEGSAVMVYVVRVGQVLYINGTHRAWPDKESTR